MSTDYYFKKWNQVLEHLERILGIDIELQNTTEPDKQLCQAVEKLNGILVGYLSIYNDIMHCKHNSLQVQKNQLIHRIVKAVDSRIVEIKHQLNKLEGSNYRFPYKALRDFLLTPKDIELFDIPEKAEVSVEMRAMIEDTKKKIIEDRERKARQKEEEEQKEEEMEVPAWFNEEEQTTPDKFTTGYEIEEKLSEETLKRKQLVAMIWAQEKTRQVACEMNFQKIKKDIWIKTLTNELKEPAPLEVRHRAAKLIQTFCRSYFQIKRNRLTDCKRDELLGLRFCKMPNKTALQQSQEASNKRMELRKQYELQYEKDCQEMKQQYKKNKGEQIAEDYTDEIRDWFHLWYDNMRFFLDIPKDNEGGSTLILNGTVPTPAEYQEYQEMVLEQQKKDKNKSATDKKRAKQEAAKAIKIKEREEASKKRMEEKLLKKMMKNPQMNPGFSFPKSEKTSDLAMVIQNYHEIWDTLDKDNTNDVKEKYVKQLELERICAEVKMEVRATVNEPMRNELKQLKEALVIDYANIEKELPTIVPPEYPRLTPQKKKRKKVKERKLRNVDIATEHLALHEIIKEYPSKTFEDFKGEPNYNGDEIRCHLKQAIPHAAEIKAIWWEKCREVTHGFNKILLVGPKGSGKSTLVYIMATINNAVLLEVDISIYADDEMTAVVAQTAEALANCARAAQPCIIYFRNVHRLFYAKKKMPPNEAKLVVALLKKNLIKKLFKHIQKHDKVTIIGSCIDPWLTKSADLLKKFPTVVMIPNTSYATTIEILREWVLSNRMVPPDLDIHTLAYVLKGYRYEYIRDALKSFLSAERIVKIAAYGVNIKEIYDHIIEDAQETKPDYDKYLKWYSEQTYWGKIEMKHLKDQLEYQELVKKYEEQEKKKKKTAGSEVSSVASSLRVKV